MGEGAPRGREGGSTWLGGSGPPGSKGVETMETEADARAHAEGMVARDVEAQVDEMVALEYRFALRINVERSGVEDGELTSTLLAKAMIRVADSLLSSALLERAQPSESEEKTAPKIVVQRLVPLGGVRQH